MLKKIVSSLCMALIATVSLSAQAATLTLSGEVTSATGAFAALTPIGTPIGGPVEVDGAALAAGSIGIADILSIDINVGGFCFSTESPSSCPMGGADVPITSINFGTVTGTGGILGGSAGVTAFSPTFMVSIPIMFDFDAGTWTADGGGLGTVGGVATLEAAPIPVPAAVWLLGSALLGMMGVRRRA